MSHENRISPGTQVGGDSGLVRRRRQNIVLGGEQSEGKISPPASERFVQPSSNLETREVSEREWTWLQMINEFIEEAKGEAESAQRFLSSRPVRVDKYVNLPGLEHSWQSVREQKTQAIRTAEESVEAWMRIRYALNFGRAIAPMDSDVALRAIRTRGQGISENIEQFDQQSGEKSKREMLSRLTALRELERRILDQTSMEERQAA